MPNFMNHTTGQKLLLEIRAILRRLEIPFFLIQGTALGAYRDNGFTPTEKDIDIGFLKENFSQRVPQLTSLLIQNGFEVRTVNAPFSFPRAVNAYKYDIKVDLVAYMRWKNKRFCSSNLKPYSIVHNHTLLEKYQRISLFSKTFLVPYPIEDYLTLEYGPDWRTPKHDHVSKSRVKHYRQTEGITNDLLFS